jgi:hypothetical protein
VWAVCMCPAIGTTYKSTMSGNTKKSLWFLLKQVWSWHTNVHSIAAGRGTLYIYLPLVGEEWCMVMYAVWRHTGRREKHNLSWFAYRKQHWYPQDRYMWSLTW